MAFPAEQSMIYNNLAPGEYERVKEALEAKDTTRIKYGTCDGGCDAGGQYFEFEGVEYYMYEILETLTQLKRIRTVVTPEEYYQQYINELKEAMEDINKNV